MHRRRFLDLSARSLVALLAVPAGRALGLERRLEALAGEAAAIAPDVKLTLKARPRRVAILPGARTPVWSFKGRVLEGGKDRLESIPGSYLGPILRLDTGDRVALTFKNRLAEPSIVHWHGLHVPEAADGHPRLAVGPGDNYHYSFEVHNRAGTYWYHPHPHERTGPQVYRGLAGLIIVSDAEERALDLPRGDYDVPLVIQDRNFNSTNELRYDGNARVGFLGETILVNGRPDYVLDVDSRPYRLRLLNGSNSRIYKLEFSDRTRVRVIGTDGGLLRKPLKRPYLTLGPAERLELWVDFGNRSAGEELVLRSLEFDHGGFGMGMTGGALPQGATFDVMRFRIAREVDTPQPVPRRLSRFPKLKLADSVNADRPKKFRYRMDAGRWTINGRTFEMEAVAKEETCDLGTQEVWDVVNQSGDSGTGEGGMLMPHPVHLHGQQFQVIERSVPDRYRAVWDTVADGYVDKGWKDTVLLMPGERVRFLRRFDDYRGLFLHHCHNLEHEDAGMMRNYRVV
ncbi:MAG: multicopper oxidase domain-containing protein [bacterium]|nr:multicopper oxidase domain-containing protein [bacterium]